MSRFVSPDAIAVGGAIDAIAPGVLRIVATNPSPLTGPGTNTYVIGVDAPVIVDPGPDDPLHLQRVLAACARPPVRVLCTHSHPDHSPGAAWLAARCGIPVHGRPAPDDGHQDPGYAPDRSLQDGEIIATDAGNLRMLHTPGHASNHVCVLLEGQGLLFTGDHLMDGSTVVILPPDGSLRDYLHSLARLAGEPIESLAPGHGKRIAQAQREIERVRKHRLAREARVQTALRALGPASLDDLLPLAYADVPQTLHALARHSLLAHLLKLLEDGQVEQVGEHFRLR